MHVLEREPRFRYGEAYLRASDALIALRRWELAEEGLETYVGVNRSSIEGWYKLSRVRAAGGNAAGAADALRRGIEVHKESPAFHRRRQLGWYLRTRFRALVS
jgi:hypothetical protein